MRIWDIDPKYLCREHLLGEHRELHAIWSIINNDKKGYRNHPETKRWIGKNKALYLRHEKLMAEMKKRGYKHNSSLPKNLARGLKEQSEFIHSHREQKEILKNKKCPCFSK
ncbi:MAG: pyrimidine dimer DNA glycosylase/endonuclease V [Patescibacteria group bacterium]|jgi:hypothetical protein